MSGNLCHAGVLDTEFLSQEGNLGLRLLESCRQAGARVKASGGPTPRVDTGQAGEGEDGEQGGPDAAAPVIGDP